MQLSTFRRAPQEAPGRSAVHSPDRAEGRGRTGLPSSTLPVRFLNILGRSAALTSRGARCRITVRSIAVTESRRRVFQAPRMSTGTFRRRGSTRRRYGAARPGSRPMERSSAIRASSPAGRPTTSSWSKIRRRRRTSGGARSTSRSRAQHSTRSSARSAIIWAARTSSSSTATPAPIRATACRSG